MPATVSPPPRWLYLALALCLLVGVVRVLMLLTHTPLIALANSYDEVRYSACFDLYPARGQGVEPTQNSPQAPYSRYAFLSNPQPMCYWSTELLFQSATTLIYRIEQRLNGAQAFSVRWIGALKFAALIGVWFAFTLTWLRRGEPWSALANGLLLPLLFADPANTIYLNTFYAEWTALLCWYALLGLVLVYDNTPRSAFAFCLLATATFALAMSKIQHLLLPLVCALVVLALGRWRDRRWPWQGLALLLGACAGLGLQGVQLQRDSGAIRAINVFNQADVVFTGLLPNAQDPAATARMLRLTPECLAFNGLRAWQMPGFPSQLCPQLTEVTRARELAVLLNEPDLSLRLGWRGVLALNPWLAPGLGKVEGGDFQELPPAFFSLSDIWSSSSILRFALLSGPLLAFAFLLARGLRGRRALPWRLLTYSALTAMTMQVTLTIAELGDGLADTPKQGHLIINAALAWWICILVLGAARAFSREAGTLQPP